MATSTTKSTLFEGITVSYTTHNLPTTRQTKPVLCFVHGWCCSSALWSSQSPIYERHPSILIDLPGHGQSSKPERKEDGSLIDYSSDFFARSINAVLKAENVSQVVLIAPAWAASSQQRFYSSMARKCFWLMPAHYLTTAQRRERREEMRDDTAFFSIFDERWTAKSSETMIARIKKTMSEETPLHVRLSAFGTDSLPHHWRWDEVYAKTPMLHITLANAPDWDEQHKHHLPNLVTEKCDGVSIFLFMEAAERYNERVETFLREYQLVQ